MCVCLPEPEIIPERVCHQKTLSNVRRKASRKRLPTSKGQDDLEHGTHVCMRNEIEIHSKKAPKETRTKTIITQQQRTNGRRHLRTTKTTLLLAPARIQSLPVARS